MLIFAENYSYDDPLNIVFLCGSHYSKKSKHDKRNILKEHIDGSTSNLHAIILEENFQFASTSKQYLSYDDIYLSGLAQIEQLASLYASKIIRFLYNGIIIKHQKTEPTYTKTSLFLCEKRRFFMARREKGVVPIIYFEKERGKSF